MAIKRAKDIEKAVQLPAKLCTMLLKGFTEQFMKDKFEALFKLTKADVKVYLEHNTDGFECDLGKGFKCEQGTVIVSQRKSYDYDMDKISDLVSKGKISIEQILACVSGFNAENLEKSISSAVFTEVATEKTTESLTFRATGDFKAKCEEEFVGPVGSIKELEKAASVDIKKELAAASPTAAQKAKLAKAKVSAKKPVDDDLDAILNGKK